jgi:RNA polymerase sigma factor (sigma-70 family)
MQSNASNEYTEFLNAMNNQKICTKEILHACINQLPSQEKEAIQSRYWGHRSLQEIANALGVSWEEADALIKSAHTKLKEGLLRAIAGKICKTSVAA